MATYTISKIELPNGDICNIKDTTYESKTAASGNVEVSLVTRGEKYNWNEKSPKIELIDLTNSGGA